jgi:hypothetical protein
MLELMHNISQESMPMSDYAETHLFVDSEGNIVGDRAVRMDMPGCQTWLCEYVPPQMHVRQLHPQEGDAMTLRVPFGLVQGIEEIRSRHLAEKPHTAKHESGHVTFSYSLRLGPVNYIDLRARVIPKGNLRESVRNPQRLDLAVVKAVTSVNVPFANQLDVRGLLTWGCFVLSGIAGCNGDRRGAEDDLRRFDILLTPFSELGGEHVNSLKRELETLASTIMNDPIVAQRHQTLAQLSEQRDYVSQTEIEGILLPDSLPDYSPSITAIGEKFFLL